jgi:hypothetical protein
MYPLHMLRVISVHLLSLPEPLPLDLLGPVDTMGRNPGSTESAQLDLGGVLRGRGSSGGTVVTGGTEREDHAGLPQVAFGTAVDQRDVKASESYGKCK